MYLPMVVRVPKTFLDELDSAYFVGSDPCVGAEMVFELSVCHRSSPDMHAVIRFLADYLLLLFLCVCIAIQSHPIVLPSRPSPRLLRRGTPGPLSMCITIHTEPPHYPPSRPSLPCSARHYLRLMHAYCHALSRGATGDCDRHTL